MASTPALAGFFGLASVLSGVAAGAGAGVGAYCVNAGKGADMRPAASTAANTVLVMAPLNAFEDAALGRHGRPRNLIDRITSPGCSRPVSDAGGEKRQRGNDFRVVAV